MGKQQGKKAATKEMVPYEEMLLLLNKLQEKQMEAELYQEGYQEFFKTTRHTKPSWAVKRNGIFLV